MLNGSYPGWSSRLLVGLSSIGLSSYIISPKTIHCEYSIGSLPWSVFSRMVFALE